MNDDKSFPRRVSELTHQDRKTDEGQKAHFAGFGLAAITF